MLSHITSEQCFIVSSLRLTRGVDYRSKAGIDLLVAYTFPTRQEYEQFLGRVARNGDAGDRFKLPTIDNPIDQIEQVTLRSWIKTKITDLKARKPKAPEEQPN